IVFGTHEELLHFRDPTTLAGGGVWEFVSLDSLALGRPEHFSRATTGMLRGEGPVADFRVRQVGVDLQDQWPIGSGLTVVGGVRLDVPFFPDKPVRNPDLLDSLGIDTGMFPNGQLLWSPRLGFNLTQGRNTVTLRGGVGLFSGRPPYYLPA